ncbi:alpha/beta fold hydrolase [Cellulomonas soli]|uniref:alpha/beta fold hydrolase n=1 Tax=Cellulomonas soli TaxID=931535 RepID=UPI003F82B1B1
MDTAPRTPAPAPATRFLPRPEGRIAWTSEGPETAPTVVLVPGMGDLRGTWRDLVEPLQAAGHRVVRTDLRGHGESDTTFRTHGDLATGSDLVALVESVGGPVVLLGSSMGAAAACWVAAARPDLVAGLVLVGPVLRDRPMPRPAAAAMRAAYRMLFARPWGGRAWTAYYGGPLTRGTRGPWLDAHLAALRANLREPGRLRSFRDLAVQLTHAPVTARLADVHAPTLAFVGDLDPDFPDVAAERAWIAQVLGADVVAVADAAHYPHHQRPDVVVPQTLRFLAGLPRTTAGAFAPAPTRAEAGRVAQDEATGA